MKKIILGVAVLGFAFAASSASALENYAGTLIKYGSRGEAVKTVQMCLSEMGYSNAGSFDGFYGMKTLAQVKSYQADKNLAQDGVVGPLTWAALDCGDTDTDTDTDTGTDGEEASLESFDLSSKDDAEEAKTQHVATIEFDVEDGDVKIERTDLTFVFTGTGTADTRPWDVFENVTLKADGKEIASMDIDSKSDWRKDRTPFQVRLSGMSYMVEAGETAKIEVYLTAQNNVDDVANADWKIYVADNGMRGTDTAGLTQEIGDATDIVTFGIDSEGGDEDIKIKSSSKNPKATTLKVEDNVVSDEYEIFVFDLESEENDITVDIINLGLTTTVASYDTLIDEAWLEIDGEKYDDLTLGGTHAAVGTATLSFDIDSDVTIDADKKEGVSLFVQFKKQTTLASGVTVKATTTRVEGEGVDHVDDTTVLNGNIHTLSLTAIDISDVKATVTEGGATAGIIDFTFKVTADNDDITVLVADIASTNTVVGATVTPAASLAKVSGTADVSGTGFTVLAGNTATLRMRYNVAGAAGNSAEVKVTTIKGQDVDVLSPTLILKA